MKTTIRTHNGTITVLNPATGNHRTFQVRTQSERARFLPGHRLVGILAGPDNRHSYQNFAFVKPRGIIVWKRYAEQSNYRKFARILWNQEWWESERGLVYTWASRCRVCNRKLTTPESIEMGIGPVCRGE